MLNKNHELNVHTTLSIGNFHTTHCEDFLINEEISTNQRVIAVLDGCTMGKEAVFASILYGKILRKIAKNRFYSDLKVKDETPIKIKLKAILLELFKETKTIKNQLSLETNELLSTLIIGIVDEQSLNAEFLAVGDGLLYIDGKAIHFEQDDKPDYLAYHLKDDFETWYALQDQAITVSSFKDLSICTDGIYTFKNFRNQQNQLTEEELFQFLLVDQKDRTYPDFLSIKMRYLHEEMNHVVTDDLAIVRIISSFPFLGPSQPLV
jgi:hypothetical protein